MPRNDMDATMTALYNERFLKKMNDPGSMAKIALHLGEYIRKKVREGSVMDKIIVPQSVTSADLIPQINGDTMYKIDELEPDAEALELNWDGMPTGEYFQGDRFITPFWITSSERLEKSEEELLAYRMPIREVLSDISANEIIRIQDQHFFRLADAAVTLTGNIVTTADTKPTPEALTDLQNLIDGNELETSVIVMHKVDFNKLKTLPSATVDLLAADLMVKGYTATTIGGMNYIVTIKPDVVAPGTIWAFVAEDYLGTNYLLQDTVFESDTKFRRVQFESRKNHGFNIANIEGVAKLTLNVSS